MKLSGPVSLVLLTVLTLVCGAYMMVGVLDMDPRKDTYSMTVLMPSSGGLMPTSEVDLRGMPIGRVRAISATATGLAVRIEVDAKFRLPIDSVVRISNLSAAGEQFMDFRPTTSQGPYLGDGSVIPAQQVRIATTVSAALANMDALSAQIDPVKISRLTSTLAQGYEGREADIRKLTRAMTLMGQMLRDKREAITRLYLNGQTLGDNFDGYGPKLADMRGDIDTGLPDLLHLIQSFQDYSYAGEHLWDDPLGPLVQQIDKYLGMLGPDLAYLATVLKPATSVIKPLRVDAGSIIDLLATVFRDGGPARIAIDIPK
ncbi:MlaD family protein [Nocardia sp. GCM10030253]|uniref:MlaD family protein n=1 Tax=Nocardia sp. GCM10030253 TaxID=3273404 RepID=UPI00362CB165